MGQGATGSACDAGLTPAAREAKASLNENPSMLEARLRLADALVAEECYQDAVHVLEEGTSLHPQNATLEARLRSARSMISEQNYIESVTRAEESARLERNLLRCRKLADIDACDEALTVHRNDWTLLVSKADALVHEGRSAEALGVYRRAAELHSGDESLQGKVRALEAQHIAQPEPVVAANSQPLRAEPAAAQPIAAQRTVRPKPVYSNQAPASRSN